MAEITVIDFTGLKNALTDATSTIIHLGSDITFTTSGGVVVPKTKGDIVIDGHGYRIEDWRSEGASDTIRFNNVAGPELTFTIQNVTWSGRNFYGVCYFPDATSTQNMTLVLDNVNYNGVQPVYHRQGTTKLINSTFLLEKNGATSDINELGEVNNLIIEGNVSVNSAGNVHSTIWFPENLSPSLVVEENAVFTVNALNTYMFYSAVPVKMLFKANSKTEINTLEGLFTSTSTTAHMASTFTLEENAYFKSTQLTRTSVPTLKCNEALTVGQNATLHIIAQTSGTAALISFYSRANLTFDNPKSILLYNNGGNVFSFRIGTTANPSIANMNAELMNIWSVATTPFSNAGGFTDTPSASFKKANDENVEALFSLSSSAILSLSNNIVDGDIGYPMSATNFNIRSAKVLSLGRLELDIDTIFDDSTTITGSADSSANIKASYLTQTVDGAADTSGDFVLPIVPIPVDTIVTIGTNWNFLTKYKGMVVMGTVRITYLPTLQFVTIPVPYGRDTVKRKNPDWHLEITDTRSSSSPDWYLYASMNNPLSHDTYILADALIIKEETEHVMSAEPYLIKVGQWQQGVTEVTWDEVRGFFLRIDPTYLYNPGLYQSTIDWHLYDSPLI